MKGRAQLGLDFYVLTLFHFRLAAALVLLSIARTSPRSKRIGLWIDQPVEFLGPILVQILKNHILLDRRIAIAFGQQRLP